jgi:hypothetical protein
MAEDCVRLVSNFKTFRLSCVQFDFQRLREWKYQYIRQRMEPFFMTESKALWPLSGTTDFYVQGFR